MTNLDKYAKPSVAVDLAIVAVVESQLKILLVNRPDDEIPGWAMPGRFVRVEDGLEQNVERVLSEKVGLDGVVFEQLATYGAIDRDPRGRVISVVYLALCPVEVLVGHQLSSLEVDWDGEAGGRL